MPNRYPGEVYFLPPDARSRGDPETRRHVLLTTCDDSSDVATCAFGSTSDTEASFGASHHEVNPAIGSYRGTGFSRVTYLYGSRLVSSTPSDFLKLAGRLIDDMAPLRDAVKSGLGIGTGTARGAGPALNSRRGAVVELATAVRAETEIKYGIIVSEPHYSLEERYQNIVPVIDAADFIAGPEDWEILKANAPWVNILDEAPDSVLAAPLWVFSVFQPTEIARVTKGVVGLRTINRLDEAFTRIFNLP
jgi:hypothetical protein